MHARYLLIASTAFAIAASAAAEPAKPASEAPTQQTPAPAKVLLASAEQVVVADPEAAQEQVAAPAKRPRAARVTSCRCAGQNER